MKIRYILLIIMLLPLVGCHEKNVEITGDVKEETFLIEDVCKLKIADITLKKQAVTYGPTVNIMTDDGAERVVIKAPSDLISALQVTADNRVLTVAGNKKYAYLSPTCVINIYNCCFNEFTLDHNAMVNVSNECLSSDILELNLSGASSFTCDTVNVKFLNIGFSGASSFKAHQVIANKTAIIASGASKITIMDSNLQNLSIGLSGASFCEVKGLITEASISLSGASSLHLDEAITTEATGNLSGASFLKINFLDALKFTLSGASTLKYHGDAQHINITCSGGSRVEEIKE